MEAELDLEYPVGIARNVGRQGEDTGHRRPFIGLEAGRALGRRLDTADDQIGGMRMAQHGIERELHGDPPHDPADRCATALCDIPG